MERGTCLSDFGKGVAQGHGRPHGEHASNSDVRDAVGSRQGNPNRKPQRTSVTIGKSQTHDNFSPPMQTPVARQPQCNPHGNRNATPNETCNRNLECKSQCRPTAIALRNQSIPLQPPSRTDSQRRPAHSVKEPYYSGSGLGTAFASASYGRTRREGRQRYYGECSSL